jgi:hypothetical protein
MYPSCALQEALAAALAMTVQYDLLAHSQPAQALQQRAMHYDREGTAYLLDGCCHAYHARVDLAAPVCCGVAAAVWPTSAAGMVLPQGGAVQQRCLLHTHAEHTGQVSAPDRQRPAKCLPSSVTGCLRICLSIDARKGTANRAHAFLSCHDVHHQLLLCVVTPI